MHVAPYLTDANFKYHKLMCLSLELFIADGPMNSGQFCKTGILSSVLIVFEP